MNRVISPNMQLSVRSWRASAVTRSSGSSGCSQISRRSTGPTSTPGLFVICWSVPFPILEARPGSVFAVQRVAADPERSVITGRAADVEILAVRGDRHAAMAILRRWQAFELADHLAILVQPAFAARLVPDVDGRQCAIGQYAAIRHAVLHPNLFPAEAVAQPRQCVRQRWILLRPARAAGRSFRTWFRLLDHLRRPGESGSHTDWNLGRVGILRSKMVFR